MKQYNEEIAGKENVEFIHYSLDGDKDSALEWAKKAEFPWFHVLPEKTKRSGLEKYKGRGVPHYVLIDKDGKQVAVGKHQVFEKVKSL